MTIRHFKCTQKIDVTSAEVRESVITTSLVGSFEERAIKVIP